MSTPSSRRRLLCQLPPTILYQLARSSGEEDYVAGHAHPHEHKVIHGAAHKEETPRELVTRAKSIITGEDIGVDEAPGDV
jgi:hypothetical protein